MSTIKERLQALEQGHQALEQGHTQLKKTIELQTIAIRALVSKEAFEKLQETVEKSQEQNGKLFDVLNNHNIFTNERLGDIQNQIIELDGKIAVQQTEIRQRFNEQDGKIAELQAEMRQHFIETDGNVAGLQTEMCQTAKQTETRFDRIETLLAQILERLPKPLKEEDLNHNG